MDLFISRQVSLAPEEVEFEAIRAQGAGGQNVNKVSTAIHVRFDIKASSLPDFYKDRLLALNDQRISKEGVIIIKAQEHRSQLRNKEDAIARLVALIRQVGQVQKVRKATRPSLNAKRKRVDSKKKQGLKKANRGRVSF